MKLEEGIKQSAFRDEYHKLGPNLMYTYHQYKNHTRNFLGSADITLQQYNVLRILRGSYPKPLTTGEIRCRMLDKMSDSSRITDRLVKLKLAEKCAAESDKRLVEVLITEAGLSLLSQIDERFESLLKPVFKALSKEEAEMLNTLLDKLNEQL